MKFNVTEIEFDFDDWYALNWDNPMTPDEARAITAIGRAFGTHQMRMT